MQDREPMHEARRLREQAKTEATRRFGAWLDATMTARGMANVELQDLIGVNNSSIGYWRRGLRIPDDWATIRALADVLDTPATQLAVLIGLFLPEELGGEHPPVDEAGVARTWIRQHPEETLEELHDWIQAHPTEAVAHVMAPIMDSPSARRAMGIREQRGRER